MSEDEMEIDGFSKKVVGMETKSRRCGRFPFPHAILDANYKE
ncbi:hypothetical protein ACFSMW_10800 [Virgibacillus halophilus]